jgi:hypothetical protein
MANIDNQLIKLNTIIKEMIEECDRNNYSHIRKLGVDEKELILEIAILFKNFLLDYKNHSHETTSGTSSNPRENAPSCISDEFLEQIVNNLKEPK